MHKINVSKEEVNKDNSKHQINVNVPHNLHSQQLTDLTCSKFPENNKEYVHMLTIGPHMRNEGQELLLTAGTNMCVNEFDS